MRPSRRRIVGGPAPQVHELRDDVASHDASAPGRPRSRTAAFHRRNGRSSHTATGPDWPPGIDFVQKGDHRPHRCVKAVEVETVEPGPTIGRKCLVVRPQPADEVTNVGVAPHPATGSGGTLQRTHGALVRSDAAHARLTRWASGQSASTATAENPFSAMSRLVKRARSR